MALPFVLPVNATGEGFATTKALLEAKVDEVTAEIQGQIDALSSGVQIVGNWDASTGAFPTTRPDASAIQQGDTWFVEVAGTVDGVAFISGDRLIALVATPGATYANNWLRRPAVDSGELEGVLRVEDRQASVMDTSDPDLMLILGAGGWMGDAAPTVVDADTVTRTCLRYMDEAAAASYGFLFEAPVLILTQCATTTAATQTAWPVQAGDQRRMTRHKVGGTWGAWVDDRAGLWGKVRTISANTTGIADDIGSTIVSSSGSSVAYTLPAAAGRPDGSAIQFAVIDSGQINISGSTSPPTAYVARRGSIAVAVIVGGAWHVYGMDEFSRSWANLATFSSMDFTAFPPGVMEIDFELHGVTLSGASAIWIRPGTGATPAATGYVGFSAATGASSVDGAAQTTAFAINRNNSNQVVSGTGSLRRLPNTTRWAFSFTGASGSVAYTSGGEVDLGGALGVIRFLPSGAVTFTAGHIAVRGRGV